MLTRKSLLTLDDMAKLQNWFASRDDIICLHARCHYCSHYISKIVLGRGTIFAIRRVDDLIS
jgi:hypothetical protein